MKSCPNLYNAHNYGHCDFKSNRRYNLKLHKARKLAALEDDQDKKGEIEWRRNETR